MLNTMWLVFSSCFVLPLSKHNLEAGQIVDQGFSGLVVICIFDSLYRTFLCHGGEVSKWALAHPLHVWWIMEVLSSAMGSCEKVLEDNLFFWQQSGLFGDFQGSLWITTELDANQIWNRKHPLLTGAGQLGFWIPHYFETSLRKPSYMF